MNSIPVYIKDSRYNTVSITLHGGFFLFCFLMWLFAMATRLAINWENLTHGSGRCRFDGAVSLAVPRVVIVSRWMNYVPRKMPDVRSRYARFTIAPIYVRMLRYMDECYGLFTTKTTTFTSKGKTKKNGNEPSCIKCPFICNRISLFSAKTWVNFFDFTMRNLWEKWRTR